MRVQLDFQHTHVHNHARFATVTFKNPAIYAHPAEATKLHFFLSET